MLRLPGPTKVEELRAVEHPPITRTIAIFPNQWRLLALHAPRIVDDGLLLGDFHLLPTDSLHCHQIGTIQVEALAAASLHYHRLTRLGRAPAAGPLCFDVHGDPRFLASHYPLLSILPARLHGQFFSCVAEVAANPNLDLRLFDDGQIDRSPDLARSARWLIAGALAEMLWARRDLLRLVLSRPRLVRLYTTDEAREEGMAPATGGYHLRRHCVELTLAQVYGTTTASASILEALGAMLDDCHPHTGRHGAANGLLPGLGLDDGPLYMRKAARLFAVGKTRECARYERSRLVAAASRPLPLGEPRHFASDTAFIAGYLEIFFRRPHAMVIENLDLYSAFSLLLNRDPRQYVATDDPGLAKRHETAYADAPVLPAHALTVVRPRRNALWRLLS
jgi:hypothetical protein